MGAVAACIDPRQLEAFSLGRIAEADASAIEEHLLHCSQCVAAVQQLSHRDTLVDAFRAQTIADKLPADVESLQKIIQSAKQLYTPAVNGSVFSPEEPAAAYDIKGLRQLDEFRIIKTLGRGGMGIVWEAEDLRLRRRVAVKALAPKHAGDEVARARFLREARAIAGLGHDNVVPIHHVGEDRGIPYFVMPLLEGEALETRCRREGALSVKEILRIGIAVADGLDASHGRGIVHRDIKPANVWLESAPGRRAEDGCLTSAAAEVSAPFRVKLLDFGLAHHVEQDIRLTQEGMLIGTPAYMSPEQTNGLPPDARSDLFSLGTVLYFLASGQLPFTGSTTIATLRAIAEQTARPLGELRPDLPQPLIALIEKLHAKEPARRFASAADLASELRRISNSFAPARPKVYAGRTVGRWKGLAAAALLLALIGLGACEAAGITHMMQALRGTGNADPFRASADQPPAEQLVVLADAPEGKAPRAYPVAVLGFEERGAKDAAAKVTDLLYARLASNDALYLVDRTDLKKVLAEAELNLSGAVKNSEATKVGQLTGARLLITGSVIGVEKKIIIVAKLIGTETSRVAAVSVEGKANDDLSALVDQLAVKLGEAIVKKADELVAKHVETKDRIASLKEKLKKGERPTLFIQIAERHVSMPKIDPAAQTELALFAKETGFPVTDDEGPRSAADIIIKGEGICETAVRQGNLVSVRARLEVKAVERKTDKVLAVDRQTVVVVDLTELLAGKAALQEAAAQIAERLLPKLIQP